MKLKVYSQGNSFIGVFPRAIQTGSRGSKVKDPMNESFKKYYREAQALKIEKRELNDFLFEKMLNDEGSYLLDLETIKEMVKKEANRLHQKIKRYQRKMGFFRPNYFLTFTYADDQTDEESFELKLRRALSNLAYRNEWRYIGVKERGAEDGRVHFHFLAYIPEGKMVGELFLDSHWSKKKKKREYFTNNTFFQERFGICRFDKSVCRMDNALLFRKDFLRLPRMPQGIPPQSARSIFCKSHTKNTQTHLPCLWQKKFLHRNKC